MSGILERVQETWTMEKDKRARKAETPKRPSPHLRSSAPALYSTSLYVPFTGPANGDEANCRKYRQSNLVILMEKSRIL